MSDTYQPTNQGGSQPDKNSVAPEVLDAPFDASEQAQFDAMQREAPQPEPAPGGAPADGQGAAADGEGAAAAGADGKPAAGAAADGAAPAVGDPPAAGADEGDEDEGDAAAAAAGQQPQVGADGKPIRKNARVHLNKYLREEKARKTAEAERDELRQQFARADERLRVLSEALSGAPRDGQQQQQQEENADPQPDKNADAFAWMEWADRRAERMEKQIEALSTGIQSTQNDTALTTAYESDAMQFAQREPNFVPAYNFLMNTRIKQIALTSFGKNLMTEGVKLTDREIGAIKATVQAEEKQLAMGALRNRQSPAEHLFVLAQTMGYVPRQPQQQDQGGQQQQAGQQQNGGQKPAQQNGQGNGAAKPTVQDTIDRVRAGQDAAVSLSNAGGGSAPPLDAKRLADMPQEEFGALLDQMTDQQFKRIAGGA